MKLGTFIKLGALAVAAVSTAAGSVFITTKALTKLTGEGTADATKNNIEKETPVVETPVETAQAPFIPVVQEPIAAPVVEERPVAPVIEALPVIEETAQPVVEEAPQPVVEETPQPVVVEAPQTVPNEEPVNDYSDVSMALPYLAGKLDASEADVADVVITPAEQEAMAAAAVVAEKPVETVAEPEVVLPTAAPIEEHPVVEPTLNAQPEQAAETFADLNPLEQGFSVTMTDSDGNNLPNAEETAVRYGDFSELAEQPHEPVTFNDISAEAPLPVVEEVAPVEVPVEAPLPVVEEAAPVEVPVEAPLPVVEEAAPVEVPVEAPLPVVEEPAPVEAPEEAGVKKIGDALVSNKADDPYIKAVTDTFNIPAPNLVSIASEGNMPMVFEFLYSDMKTDATLMSVYFIMPDGQATLPPETDRENVLAFGRNFITGNEELKAFLA